MGVPFPFNAFTSKVFSELVGRIFLCPPIELSPCDTKSACSTSSLKLRDGCDIPVSLFPSLLDIFLAKTDPFKLGLIAIFVAIFTYTIPSILGLTVLFVVPAKPIFPFPSECPFAEPSYVTSTEVTMGCLSAGNDTESQVTFKVAECAIDFFASESEISGLTFDSPLVTSIGSPRATIPRYSPADRFFAFTKTGFAELEVLLTFFASSDILSVVSSKVVSVYFTIVTYFASFDPS